MQKKSLVLAVFLALAAPLSQSAQAATVTPDFWDVDSSWSPPGAPALADDVIVGAIDAAKTSLFFDTQTEIRSANSLQINSDMANMVNMVNTISFAKTGDLLTITTKTNETVASTGSGSYSPSTGYNAVGTLILDLNSGSNGNYNLDLGSLVADREVIGNYGSGTMTLAANPGSTGTYNLSGGTLRAANIAVNSGSAFNFTGGNLNANIADSGNFNLRGGGTRIVDGDGTNNASGSIKTTGSIKTPGYIIGGVGFIVTNNFTNISANTLGGIIGSGSDLNPDRITLDYRHDGGQINYLDGTQFSAWSTPIAPKREPTNYAVLLAGLGLMGFSARHRKQHA